MGDLLYFFNLDKKEYFGDVHKETEWRLNSKSLLPLIDLLHHYSTWARNRITLDTIMLIDGEEGWTDISDRVYNEVKIN